MSQLDPPVLPASLSSSSIYLTEDYAAKISDMDLWKGDKDLQDEESVVVYMLGILVLEVISGPRPARALASSYLDGKRPLNTMADPMLRSSVPDRDVAALCDVVRLCIHPDKERRPAMGEVARQLRGVTGLSPEQATPLWWAELEIASAVESG
ncbi:unnamed protein product [Urochloa humidicola]